MRVGVAGWGLDSWRVEGLEVGRAGWSRVGGTGGLEVCRVGGTRVGDVEDGSAEG